MIGRDRPTSSEASSESKGAASSDITAMTTAQAAALTTEQIVAFTTDQIAGLASGDDATGVAVRYALTLATPFALVDPAGKIQLIGELLPVLPPRWRDDLEFALATALVEQGRARAFLLHRRTD